MTDAAIQTLTQAVGRYFQLMYDGDVARFDQVFRPTAQLHGIRDGALALLTAADYRARLASRPSPRSVGAPREEEILMLDLVGADQALAKVRVRIDTVTFVDYLLWHRIDGSADDGWRVTAKSFHVEHLHPAQPAA